MSSSRSTQKVLLITGAFVTGLLLAGTVVFIVMGNALSAATGALLAGMFLDRDARELGRYLRGR